MPISQGTVGPVIVSDGAQSDLRLSRLGAVTISDAHGIRREATSRGRIFVASTGTAGVAPGTALSTTPPFSLYCPAAATVKLSILEARVAYVSGTIGTGDLVYGQVQGQTTTPSGGTVLTPVPTNLSAVAGQGLARQGSTHIGSPTLIEAMGTLTPALATTVLNPLVIIQDMLNGKYEVPPGVAFAIQGVAAAGSTPLVMISVTWEEIPV